MWSSWLHMLYAVCCMPCVLCALFSAVCGIAKTVAELLFKPTERRIKNQHSRSPGAGTERGRSGMGVKPLKRETFEPLQVLAKRICLCGRTDPS